MLKAKIEAILQEKLKPSYLNVIDDGHKHVGHEGAKQGGHFTVEIACEAFAGRSLLERHRLVYAALAGLPIHALAIKTKNNDKK